MSVSNPPTAVELDDIVARIRRNQAESDKFAAEQRKLTEESLKLAAERAKLDAERSKFDRERHLAPWIAAGAVAGVAATLVTLLLRALGVLS